MFKKLQELFGKKSLLQEALEDSWTMLRIDKSMFDASVRSLREQDTSEVEIDIYQTDREINRFEQEIRKKVFTHLAVSGSTNLSIGLTLVSTIIDIERIGDYTKNIYELANVHPKRLLAGKWQDNLKMMESTVSHNLGSLIEALRESDDELGRQIITDMARVKKYCDEYVMSLIKGLGESFQKGEAVSLVLYLRYLKRIAGHLQNVATSIVNPFHQIGYMQKRIKFIDD
ncbi:MAG: phosphate uptake regulator PhoU [bacterium]